MSATISNFADPRGLERVRKQTATVAIVGDGPAGISAGLFAGENGLNTVHLDTDKTWTRNE